MSGLFTYPWALAREELDAACINLAARGVDTLTLASHYHSVRSFSPRFPNALFETREGGAYFEPGSEFDDLEISPPKNEISGMEDPLMETVETAAAHDIEVNAWTVYLHNTKLGREYPEYQLEDAFGNAHEHAFCPANEAVREYFTAVTRAVASRGVGAVEVESAEYPSVFHEHNTRFGHPKRHVLTSDTGSRLFSQCFCDACRRRARDHRVDLNQARETVQRLVQDAFDQPGSEPMALGDLVQETPILQDLFDFRESVIDEFVGGIADAASSEAVDVVPYAFEAADGWQSGLSHDVLEHHADRLKVLCYVSDPTAARSRLKTFERNVDLPLDAAITLDPAVLKTEREFRAMVDAIRNIIDGEVTVYNHALLTDAQLDWVERVFS